MYYNSRSAERKLSKFLCCPISLQKSAWKSYISWTIWCVEMCLMFRAASSYSRVWTKTDCSNWKQRLHDLQNEIKSNVCQKIYFENKYSVPWTKIEMYITLEHLRYPYVNFKGVTNKLEQIPNNSIIFR